MMLCDYGKQSASPAAASVVSPAAASHIETRTRITVWNVWKLLNSASSGPYRATGVMGADGHARDGGAAASRPYRGGAGEADKTDRFAWRFDAPRQSGGRETTVQTALVLVNQFYVRYRSAGHRRAAAGSGAASRRPITEAAREIA
jgi:hypothetical protein